MPQISSWTDLLIQVISEDIGRIAWNSFLALVPLVLSFSLFYQPRSRWFSNVTYILLTISFIVGIKKYNNGDLLVSLVRTLAVWWEDSTILTLISLCSIVLLVTVDRRFRSPPARNRSLLWWIGLCLFTAILPNAPYILTDVIHFYDAVRAIDSAWTITLVVVPIYLIFIGVGWFAYVFSLINVGRYLMTSHLDNYINIAELSLHFLCAIGIYIGRFLRFNSWNIVTHPQKIISVLPEELIGKFPVVVILLTFSIIALLYAICKPMGARSSVYRA
ncbi:DUF1361 domain-containing protein [Chamaesiphon sp.]|uniref:DUF1361 domain-containing protein n=1 Tax=Chamaesiphon sp. TaxID=2814140 RepID=UPI00359302B9